MNRWTSFALLTVVLTALSGCGIKGPLYLPEEAENKPVTQQAN